MQSNDNIGKIKFFNDKTTNKINESISSIKSHINKENKINSNLHLALTSAIQELYTLIKFVDFDKEKFYQNIIITGEKQSGKSSLIEYLINIDLFPKDFQKYSKRVSILLQI
jgi:hypothetical protein